eukprot:9891290-Karenia_brevis.AAC.1
MQKKALEQGEQDPFPEGIQGPWLTNWLWHWRERYELSFRTKNLTYSLSFEDGDDAHDLDSNHDHDHCHSHDADHKHNHDDYHGHGQSH